MSLKEETKRTLARYGIRLSKRFGQNLLINDGILQRIVDGANLNKDDEVLEIGPGIGTLTRRLADVAGRVIAVEIDPSLTRLLKKELCDYRNVEIIHGDILRVDLSHLFSKKVKVVANLPYSIATRVIIRLLNEWQRFTTLVLMVQKEVGERILARPGNKAFGSLTLFVAYHAFPELITYVPKASFFPAPKVDGAVLRLKILQAPYVRIEDEGVFFRVIRSGFLKRRKLLINALSTGLDIEKGRVRSIFSRAGIPMSKRAEETSLSEFATISDLFIKEGLLG